MKADDFSYWYISIFLIAVGAAGVIASRYLNARPVFVPCSIAAMRPKALGRSRSSSHRSAICSSALSACYIS